MKSLERLLLPVLVVVPVLLLGLLPIAPRPVELTLAWQRAVLAEAAGSPHEAARFYRQVIRYQPERVDLWDKTGELEFLAEDYEAAIQSYNQAIENHTVTVGGMLNLGDSYQRQGDLNSAAATWVKVAEMPTVEPQQLSAAAQRLRDIGDLDATLVVASRWHET